MSKRCNYFGWNMIVESLPQAGVTIKATKNLLTTVLLSREKCCYTISKKVSPGNLMGRCCCCPQKCFWDCSKIPKKRKKSTTTPPPKKNSQTYRKCFPEYIGSNTSTQGESKRTVGCYSVPIVQNTTQEKSVCMCACVCVRTVSNSWCIYEIVHMLGWIYFLGSLKDKAVWVVLRPSFLYRCY